MSVERLKEVIRESMPSPLIATAEEAQAVKVALAAVKEDGDSLSFQVVGEAFSRNSEMLRKAAEALVKSAEELEEECRAIQAIQGEFPAEGPRLILNFPITRKHELDSTRLLLEQQRGILSKMRERFTKKGREEQDSPPAAVGSLAEALQSWVRLGKRSANFSISEFEATFLMGFPWTHVISRGVKRREFTCLDLGTQVLKEHGFKAELWFDTRHDANVQVKW